MVDCRRFCGCLGLAALAGLSLSASALADEAVTPKPIRVTSVERLVVPDGQPLPPIVNRGPGTTLYSATAAVPVGNVRFNPGNGGPGGAGGVTPDVTIDDVPMLNAAAQPQVEIRSIVVGVRQGAGSPGCDVNVFATELSGDGSTPALLNSAPDLPLTLIGTQTLAPRTAAGFVTVVFTYNLATPLTLDLNNDLFPAFGAVGVGLQFSGAGANDTLHGWLTRNPDAGFANAAQLFWIYDDDQIAPDDRGAFTFGDPAAGNPPSTFYIQLVGDIVGAGSITGACCDTIDGTCLVLTQTACESFTGTAYQGDNTTCVPNVTCGVQGACCFGSCCAISLEATCPMGNTWIGGVTCTPASVCGTPANDACANATPVTVGDNPGFSCNATTGFSISPAATCGGFAGSGGATDVWHTFVPAATAEYIFSTCNAVGYDTVLAIYEGACPTDGTTPVLACNDDRAPACSFNPFASEITITLNAGTTYFIRVAGYGTNDTDGETGAYVLTITLNAQGACCAPGSPTCFIESATNCTNVALGTFLGANSTCEPEPCPGACCAIDATCSALTEAACIAAGGTFQGVNTVCDQVSCPVLTTGACCISGVCSVTTSTTCAGTYQGDNTSCTPNPCAPATGACCCGSTCIITTAAACTGSNRVFAGGGSVCTPFSNTAPCCRADFNKSGPTPTVQDIFDFLSGYFNTDPCSDTNDSNTITVQDIFDYLGAYFGGGCS
ncbi:MAG: hypothetical protein ACK4WH_03865 [Phycisphaerales bacterium]